MRVVPRALTLVVALTGCQYRYMGGVGQSKINLNAAATKVASQGMMLELELLDSAGIARATLKDSAEILAKEAGGDYDKTTGVLTYTKRTPTRTPGLDFGLRLRGMFNTVADVERTGGLFMAAASGDNEYRDSEIGLLIRKDGYTPSGVGYGFYTCPSIGGVVIDRKENLATTAGWPVWGRVHYAPPPLGGLTITVQGGVDLFALQPEGGAEISWQSKSAWAWYVAAGWKREAQYAWSGDMGGTLVTQSFYASLGYDISGLWR